VIPEFDADGNLPPGIHDATLEEIEVRFGVNATRKAQIEGLRLALRDLRRARCSTVCLDGSFVTDKAKPGDFDGCWEADGVNWDDLHPALRKVKAPRVSQKKRYRGELVISDTPSEPFGPRYVDFFQQDGRTGIAKGIIRIDLEDPK
jgi:hypothetical protein